MNKLIAPILLFSSIAHSSMAMKDFPHEIPSKSVTYSLSPPRGFESLKVTFNMSGTVDNEIASIRIDTGRADHVIESSQLDIDFDPNLNEIRFHENGDRKEVDPVYFNIFYGVPQKMKCGLKGFEYLQKAIKITIHPTDEPTVERNSSFFETCKRLTELEGSHEK